MGPSLVVRFSTGLAIQVIFGLIILVGALLCLLLLYTTGQAQANEPVESCCI